MRRYPWDSRVAWSILERLGRLDRGSNPRYPIIFYLFYIYQQFSNRSNIWDLLFGIYFWIYFWILIFLIIFHKKLLAVIQSKEKTQPRENTTIKNKKRKRDRYMPCFIKQACAENVFLKKQVLIWFMFNIRVINTLFFFFYFTFIIS